MRRSFRANLSSLRTRLILLVLIAVIPAFLWILISAAGVRREEIRDAERRAMRVAVLAAEEHQICVEGARQLLQTIARTNVVRRGDPDACAAFLATLLKQAALGKRGEVFENIGVVDAEGGLRASAAPLEPAAHPQTADQSWFQRVLRTKDFVVGECRRLLRPERRILPAAYPIHEESGDVVGVAFVLLNLGKLDALVARAQLSAESVILVVDAQGLVVARHPESAQFPGRIRPAEWDAGAFRARDPDGTARRYGTHPVWAAPGAPAAFILVGIPEAEIALNADAGLWRNLAGLAVATFLAMAGAWGFSNVFILRRVRTLVNVTRRLTAGDLSARTGVAGEGGELEQLSRAFDQMAESLELREKALKSSEHRLARQNRVLADLMAGGLLEGQDLAATFRRVTEAVADTMEVERVGVWLYAPERDRIRGVDLYERGQNRHSSGKELWAADYPAYFHELETARVIAAHDARTDPRTRELTPNYLVPSDIASMLAVPLRKGGRMMGVLCQEHVGSIRRWESEEQAFVGSMADQIALAMEASERRRTEEELRRSEENYRLLIANMPDVLWTADEQGRIVFISPNVERILGFAPEEIYARGDLLRFGRVHPEDVQRAKEAYLALFAGSGRYDVEYRVQRGDRKWVWLQDRAVATFEKEGALYASGLFSDVTEKRQLEDQFRQSQKMEAVGRLAGGVAHDFNNILTVINGYSEILLTRIPADDPLRAPVDQIRHAGHRAALLTRQLLSLSRKHVVQPELIDLNAVVAQSEGMFRRLIGEDIRLETKLSEGLGMATADPGLIEQILLNLVVNSRDAMPDGGTIVIETANRELDEAYARMKVDVRPGPYVMLSVNDTGHGMDAEVQAHLFEPFFTTKEKGKGTGLGLLTVYGIVNQCGGHISVASEVGKGTTFRIYLPKTGEAAPKKEAPRRRTASPRGSETILLAEDEETVRALAGDILRANGYRVLEASDGVEALRVFEQEREKVRLMVTDVVMPRMSGPELARQAEKIRPDVRVLFMSGYTGRAMEDENLVGRGKDFLQKPFTASAFLDKVRELLDGGTSAA
ncbi:MAG: response regulator [Planctomycetes bacterium]|nr:response regulator [Planctomycetota bacterium]